MPLPTSVPETAESAYLRVVATASSVKANPVEPAILAPLASLITAALATFA